VISERASNPPQPGRRFAIALGNASSTGISKQSAPEKAGLDWFASDSSLRQKRQRDTDFRTTEPMTEVLFYHLQDMTLENVLPPLLEKSLERGWRVVVQSTSEERADALDAHLWTYRDDSFLPHTTWRAGDAEDHPIVLAVEEDNPNRANVRFLIDSARLPEDSGSYERIVLVFNGDDSEALAAARAAWTDCKTRGFEVTYWQADERGRWQRRD
jgi:DNA polymerase-3 subunit chi